MPKGNILITSALKGEGKTFIALELAIARALKLGSSKPVLFIDLNSLNRDGGQILLEGSEQSDGSVVDFLRGQKTLSQCVSETSISGLFIMPYGLPPDDFEPLQHLYQMDNLIKEASKEYQVIIDSGPVFLRNRRNFDPVEIGQIVDAVILVTLSGKTPREVVLRCKKDFESNGAKIGGIIMNDRFVRPFRSEVSRYLSWLEKVPGVRQPVQYFRARLGIY